MNFTLGKSRIYKVTLTVSVAILFVCSLALSGIFCIRHAHADGATGDATAIVKHDTDCAYFYFDYPTAVYAASGKITVADKNTAYVFDSTNPKSKPLEIGTVQPDTSKLAKYGNVTVTLSKSTLTVGSSTFEGISDFALSGDTIYAVRGDEICSVTISDGESISELRHEISYNSELEAIAVGNNKLYAVTPNLFNPYMSDVIVYNIDGGVLTAPITGLTSSNKILSIEAVSGGAVTLTRDGLQLYTVQENGMFDYSRALTGYDIVGITTDGDTVYGISQLKSIFKISADFSKRTEIMASAHQSLNFFSSNAGIATRRNMIAVADEYNNRVQIIREDNTNEISGLFRPKAVAIDYYGDIYVAHNQNTISVYDSVTLALKRSFSPDGTLGSLTITDLKIDSDNNVYILSRDGQVYKANNLPLEPIGEKNAKAMAVSQKDNTLYIATADNKIVKIGDSTAIVTCASEIADFCTDLNGSIYVLTTSGTVAKYERGTSVPSESSDLSDKLVGATKIIMNTVNFDSDISLSYGDILISDTAAHALKSINADVLEVNKGIDMSNTAPEIDSSRVPYNPNRVSKEIIFTVASAEIYPSAAEINALPETVKDGMTVIIPDYNASATFNLMLADNIDGGTQAAPITGYIHKLFITEKLEYKPSQLGTCYAFIGIKIYKYPSYNAPVADECAKDTRFSMLDFVYTGDVYGYTDNRNNLWYRIAYSGDDGKTYEGYVMSKYIRVGNEIPDDRNVYPRPNAKIISLEKGKNIPATLFSKDANGKIVEVDDPSFPPLAVGTEVEVVGTFDSSEEFTLIKYYHEGVGTVQYYVYTANLEYDGVNRVVIIAIVLIVLTVLLGIILVARFMYLKRNRKVTEDTKL